MSPATEKTAPVSDKPTGPVSISCNITFDGVKSSMSYNVSHGGKAVRNAQISSPAAVAAFSTKLARLVRSAEGGDLGVPSAMSLAKKLAK